MNERINSLEQRLSLSIVTMSLQVLYVNFTEDRNRNDGHVQIYRGGWFVGYAVFFSPAEVQVEAYRYTPYVIDVFLVTTQNWWTCLRNTFMMCPSRFTAAAIAENSIYIYDAVANGLLFLLLLLLLPKQKFSAEFSFV